MPQLESQSQRDHTQVEDEAEDGVDERKEGFGRPKLDSFQFDHTGPFEPLVLSAPGDAPVVQAFGASTSRSEVFVQLVQEQPWRCSWG